MDAIAGLLDGPRARNAFLLRTVFDPPWSIRIEDRAPLTVVAIVRGDAWVLPDGGEPVQLHPGDVAVLRGPDPYVFADDPATQPRIRIDEHQQCHTFDGQSVAEPMSLGVRTWGSNADGASMMLVGTYVLPGETSQRVLRALPTLLVLREHEWDGTIVRLLHDEIGRDGLGQEAVLDRLLDLLVVAVLRTWFARPAAGEPRWYRAQGDPVVGQALQLLQNHPSHPWTVGSLAAEVGLSRAALARRFTELVGEPPMAFLATWRLSLAADLLAEPGATVGSVAGAVGYGSPFALSTAFKRVRGISPAQHRARSLPSAAA